MSDGKVIDFGVRALGLMRERLIALDEANACLVSNTRVHLTAVAQIHAAALALFEARSIDHFVHIVTQDWPDTLKVDAVALALVARREGTAAGCAALPRVDPVLLEGMAAGGICFVPDEQEPGWLARDEMLGHALFGPAAALIERQALVRLPLRDGLPPAILALGSRAPLGVDGSSGAQLLGFLGAVTAHLLAGWLRPGG
jgi:uncharacterized protein YigA (DUF484 family)